MTGELLVSQAPWIAADGRKIERLELHLTYTCPERCAFSCSASAERSNTPLRSLSAITNPARRSPPRPSPPQLRLRQQLPP